MAAWELASMDSRGRRPHRLDELEDQCCRHHTRRYGAYYRDSTPGDCLEARSSLLALLGGRQRDPSGAAGGNRLRSIIWHCTRGRYFV
jgi:hypothetical protein